MEIMANSTDLFQLSSGRRPDLPPTSKMADGGVATQVQAECPVRDEPCGLGNHPGLPTFELNGICSRTPTEARHSILKKNSRKLHKASSSFFISQRFTCEQKYVLVFCFYNLCSCILWLELVPIPRRSARYLLAAAGTVEGLQRVGSGSLYSGQGKGRL